DDASRIAIADAQPGMAPRVRRLRRAPELHARRARASPLAARAARPGEEALGAARRRALSPPRSSAGAHGGGRTHARLRARAPGTKRALRRRAARARAPPGGRARGGRGHAAL